MTQEQTLETLFWLPETGWRIVATLTSTPAPASFNAIYVREWISEIASTVEFQGYPEVFIVTEIDEERHVRPLIHVLLRGTDESRLSEYDEPWRNSWQEISAGGFADMTFFREGQGPQAISHFVNCLSETGIFMQSWIWVLLFGSRRIPSSIPRSGKVSAYPLRAENRGGPTLNRSTSFFYSMQHEVRSKSR